MGGRAHEWTETMNTQYISIVRIYACAVRIYACADSIYAPMHKMFSQTRNVVFRKILTRSEVETTVLNSNYPFAKGPIRLFPDEIRSFLNQGCCMCVCQCCCNMRANGKQIQSYESCENCRCPRCGGIVYMLEKIYKKPVAAISHSERSSQSFLFWCRRV
jgi:hypothetical protein